MMQQAFSTFGLGERVSARKEDAVDYFSDPRLLCLIKARHQKDPVFAKNTLCQWVGGNGM